MSSFINIKCFFIRWDLNVLSCFVLIPVCLVCQCAVTFLLKFTFICGLIMMEMLTFSILDAQLIALIHSFWIDVIYEVFSMLSTSLSSGYFLWRHDLELCWEFEYLSSMCFYTKLEPERTIICCCVCDGSIVVKALDEYILCEFRWSIDPLLSTVFDIPTTI